MGTLQSGSRTWGQKQGEEEKNLLLFFFVCNTPIIFLGIFFFFGVTPEYAAGGSRSFHLLSWTSATCPPGLHGFASLVSAHVQAL